MAVVEVWSIKDRTQQNTTTTDRHWLNLSQHMWLITIKTELEKTGILGNHFPDPHWVCGTILVFEPSGSVEPS